MKLKVFTSKLTNGLDNGLSTNSCVNLMQELQEKREAVIREEKERIIKEKLKEIIGIEIDIEEEEKRRFKRLVKVYSEGEEIIYFNDGTVEGKRIVTFVYNNTLSKLNNEIYKTTQFYFY